MLKTTRKTIVNYYTNGRVIYERAKYVKLDWHLDNEWYSGFIFIPPELLIQLPAWKSLKPEHLEICPEIWMLSPLVARKLLSKEDFERNKNIWGTDSKWKLESALKYYQKQRENAVKNVFGFNSMKDFKFVEEHYVHDKDGKVIYSESGAFHKDFKQNAKFGIMRTKAIMKIMPILNNLKQDIEDFERKLLAGDPVEVADLYHSFERSYSLIKGFKHKINKRAQL